MKSLYLLTALTLLIAFTPVEAVNQTLAQCGVWVNELGILAQAREGRMAVEITFAPKTNKNPSSSPKPLTQILFVGPITKDAEASVVFRDGYLGNRTEVFCRSCIISGSVKLRPDVPDTVGLIGDAASKITEPGQVIEFSYNEGGKVQMFRGQILDLGREADVKFREKLKREDVKDGEIPIDATNIDPDPRMVVKVVSVDRTVRLIDLYEIEAKSIRVVVDEKLALIAKQLAAINMVWHAIVASNEPADSDKPSLAKVRFKNGETVLMQGAFQFVPDPASQSVLLFFNNEKGAKGFVRVYMQTLAPDGKGFTETPHHVVFYEGDDVVLTSPQMAGLEADSLVGPFIQHGMLLGKVGANGELVWGINMDQMGWFKRSTEGAGLVPFMTQSFAYYRPGTSTAFGSPGWRPPAPK